MDSHFHPGADEKGNSQTNTSEIDAYSEHPISIEQGWQRILALKNGTLFIIKNGSIFIKCLTTGKITESRNKLPATRYSHWHFTKVVPTQLKELPDGCILITCTYESSLLQSWELPPLAFSCSSVPYEFYTYHPKKRKLKRETDLEKEGVNILTIVELSDKTFACTNKHSNICIYHCEDLSTPTYKVPYAYASYLAVLQGRYLVAKIAKCLFPESSISIYKINNEGVERLTHVKSSFEDGQIYGVDPNTFIEMGRAPQDKIVVNIWKFDENADSKLHLKNKILIPFPHMLYKCEPQTYDFYVFPDQENVMIRGNPYPVQSCDFDLRNNKTCCAIQSGNTLPHYCFNINTLSSSRLHYSYDINGSPILCETTFFSGTAIDLQTMQEKYAGGNIIKYNLNSSEKTIYLRRYNFFSKTAIQFALDDAIQLPRPITRIISEYAQGSLVTSQGIFSHSSDEKDSANKKNIPSIQLSAIG